MDRAYEGNETQRLSRRLGYEPVVPPHPLRRNPWKYDKELYKRRNEWVTLLDQDGVEYVEFKANYTGEGIYESLFNDNKNTALPKREIIHLLDNLQYPLELKATFKQYNSDIVKKIETIFLDHSLTPWPLSIPLHIFTRQYPVPKDYLPARYYNNHIMKYILSNYYNFNTLYYYPIPVNAHANIFINSRLKINKFIFDDKKMIIYSHITYEVSNNIIEFTCNSLNNNSIYYIDDNIYYTNEEFNNFKNGNMRNIQNNHEFKNIFYRIDTILESRNYQNTYIHFYENIPDMIQSNSKYIIGCNLSINILDTEPFTISISLHTLSEEKLNSTYLNDNNKLVKFIRSLEKMKISIHNIEGQ